MPSRRGLCTLALASVAMALSCSSATAPVAADDLRFRSLPAGLDVSNPAPATAFYAMIPTRIQPLVLIATCVRGPYCQAVPGNGSVLVPWETPGSPVSADPDYTLFWWRAAADTQGGGRPDSVRIVRIVRIVR